MSPVPVRLVNPTDVDARTLEVRLTDVRTSYLLVTSTAWAFEGGDALCVPDNGKGHTVLRLGDKVKVYEGSLAKAFHAEGIEFKVL